MASSSQQHDLDLVRRPRVQISYDVETEGATETVELPFVVGVLADLSGQPKTALPALKDRTFVNIDRDNFDQVLAKSTPRLALKVDDKISGQLSVPLDWLPLGMGKGRFFNGSATLTVAGAF